MALATDLQVSVYDRRLLFVHVMHGTARLVKYLYDEFAWQGALVRSQDIYQLTAWRENMV